MAPSVATNAAASSRASTTTLSSSELDEPAEEAPDAEPAEEPMTTQTRLHPGQRLHIEIVSRQPTATDPVHLRWLVDGQAVFTRADPAPRLSGWFALRTTASRLQIQDFQILQCR